MKCDDCPHKDECANSKPPCFVRKFSHPWWPIPDKWPDPPRRCEHVFPWWGMIHPSHCPICGEPLNIQPVTVTYSSNTINTGSGE